MIIFKYKKELSGVKRPVADVFLKSKLGGWIEFHPYIDSGADITLIPLSLGKLIGLSKNHKKVEKIGGIRGTVPVIYSQTVMKIGGVEMNINIAWALSEKVPPLLGRRDIFDKFHITFKQDEEEVIFKMI